MNSREEEQPENIEKRMENSLIELDNILEAKDPIDILCLRRDCFLYEMKEIMLMVKNFDYAWEVLEGVHKKNEITSSRWLTTFEYSIEDILRFHQIRFQN